MNGESTGLTEPKNFSYSAPGSVMITGEHAVVYGYPAIVCAVDQGVSVEIRHRADRLVKIVSAVAPETRVSLNDLRPDSSSPLRFVLSCLYQYRNKVSSGFDVTIRSQINPTLGLGSSAAVTVAMLACLQRLAGVTETLSVDEQRRQLHTEALKIVRNLQGRGSGADLAACIYGGLVSYRLVEDESSAAHGCAEIGRLPPLPSLYLAYSGYKTPTAEVLARVANDMVGQAEKYEALYFAMGNSSSSAITAAADLDWAAFGKELNHYQELMQQLGVSDQRLDELVVAARSESSCLAAKISGSGLGDCVLAISDAATSDQGAFRAREFHQMGIDEQGARCHL